MTDNDIRARLAVLEMRRRLGLWVIIALAIAVGVLLADLATRELGWKSITARHITVKSRRGYTSLGPTHIWMWQEQGLDSRASSLWIGPEKIQIRSDIDAKPGHESIVEISAHDDDLKVMPHIFVYQSDHPGVIGTAIGACRLHQETPEGKKVVTELPASSIVLFDDKGHVKKALP